MSKSTDERGRLYLPKDVRERYGDRYRIVEFPSHVALFPVDEEPLDGVRDAVGSAFEGVEAAELAAEAGATFERDVRERAERRDDDGE